MDIFSDETIFLAGIILAAAAAAAGIIGSIIYRVKIKRLKIALNDEYGANTPTGKAQ